MSRKGDNIRRRKDGRWEARYPKGRKSDGSILYGSVYAKKYGEAKQKQTEALRALSADGQPSPLPLPSPTFQTIFDNWEADVRYTIKESSFFLYQTILERHLRPYFGPLRADQLTQKHIQDFLILKRREALSPAYIRSILRLFHNILRKSQLPDIQMPSLPQPSPKGLELFSQQEWLRLKNYLQRQPDDFSFGILLCMYTGLRVGELSGLRWDDYDPDHVQFRIKRTVQRIKNAAPSSIPNIPRTHVSISSPKTPSSIRDIPLPYCLLPELQLHRGPSGTYVLTGTHQCMEPRCIQKKYRRLLADCGIRYLNFHSLRHSFATFCIQNGSDHKTVAELLGHSSVNTTLNIYVHSSLERKRQCLEHLMQ